jgi:hypothetical protein
MRLFKNLKVAAQLILGFSVVNLMLIGFGLFSLSEMKAENAHVGELRDNWLPSVRSSLQMQNGLLDLRTLEYRIASASAPSDVQDTDAHMDATIAGYHRAAAEYEALMTEPEEKAAYADIQALMPQYLALDQQVRALAKAGSGAAAGELLRGQSYALRTAIDKDISTIVDVNVAGAGREGEAAASSYSRRIRARSCS